MRKRTKPDQTDGAANDNKKNARMSARIENAGASLPCIRISGKLSWSEVTEIQEAAVKMLSKPGAPCPTFGNGVTERRTFTPYSFTRTECSERNSKVGVPPRPCCFLNL